VKTAVVCDWLTTYAGAERVVEQILNIYPEADVYCIVDFLSEKDRAFLAGRKPRTSFIQRLPKARTNYRMYLPLMPLAIEQLDVTGYDLVLSSSHAVAKGILTGPEQTHISYVHSPMRYAWDLQSQYLKEAHLEKGIKSILARCLLHYMRLWDYRTASGVDYFIANSNFIAGRIKKVYARKAQVIYPPVDTEEYSLWEEKEDYYVTVSRLVPYKKVRLLVEAFNEMEEKKLIVLGGGPQYEEIRKIAKRSIELLGWQSFERKKEILKKAKAFVFAAEEDFGIAPVEAQACGTPVIAYGKGGALETVRGLEEEEPTGVFFHEQTVEAVKEAVKEFEENEGRIRAVDCRKNAERFSEKRFRQEFKTCITRITDEKRDFMKEESRVGNGRLSNRFIS